MGIGSFVANVGRSLHLPELGISEALGGKNTYSGTLPNGQQWLGQGKTYQEAYNNALAYNAARPQQTAAAPSAGADTGIYTAGGGASGGRTTSPNYDFLVDDQLGRLDGQQNVGMSNILGAYNSAFQTLTNQRDTTRRNYQIQTDQTQQDNVKAKASIDEGVRTNITALSRLLGGKGAGNSSAATILAPYAAGVQGNAQRSDVQDAYGRNMGSIDLAKKDAEDQFETSFGQLGADRGNQENALRAKIADTRAQLLAAKGDPALQGRIADLGRMVDSLGAVQSFTPRAVDAKAPDLSKYNYEEANPEGANLQGDENGMLPGVGAYSTLLGLSKKKPTAATAAV